MWGRCEVRSPESGPLTAEFIFDIRHQMFIYTLNSTRLVEKNVVYAAPSRQ
jgi:hypothetical protein